MSAPTNQTEKPEPITSHQTEEVTFEDFQRIDIRIAKVLDVERIPNSARLLKLKLDLSGSQKQCIAGVGMKYEPEQLKDKLIAVVTNLKPRKIMGLTSEVMLLAAADGPDVSALVSDRQVSSGAKVT